nr:integrase, catalytic region, zinc finger, CCHC-type, peptidase aspartic, catalytic [Tanacetum cinerariifolium]
NQGETIHAYYVWFAKLINDMRNIKMTMSIMQLNSKFVNNMLPERGRFVTPIKLNRGLRDSNYDQLYAYLKQHEAHANENKMMLDRFTQHTVDPLALMSNVSHQQPYSQSSTTPPSTYVPPYLADNAHIDSGLSLTDNLIENLTNTLALLTQSYKTFLPQINNQLKTSSNTRNQATVQDGKVVVQNVQGGQDNAIDEDMDEQPVQDLSLNVDNMFQADDYDVFDSDVDEAPMVQTMFMVNLSSIDPVYDRAGPSYDSDILSEVHDHDHYQDAVCEHHEEHEMHDNIQLNYVVDSHVDYTSDSNMIPYDQYVKDNAVPVNKLNCMKDRPENFLETFTPRKQLTHEQIFWSQDLIKMKTEALKEQTTASRPIKALTVYPPNIHETLVPRVLLTESQVKIHIFTLIQLFLEFDKTCKKRIIPTGLTEGERGFEQTKECYLKEVIPFFKTLKEHFEGIQKALTKEIKEMKYVFEELEAEVAQNVVDRKHDAIKQKNLLIANDNLIAECLSKEVFYVATNSELNVCRFTEMHVPNTIVEARCLELEAKLSNLLDKSHNDNHNEALDSQITQLTKKVTVLQAQNDLFRAENRKIKQHYKELYDSIKITRAKYIEQVTALTTKNVYLKAQILNNVNSVSKDHVKPIVLAPDSGCSKHMTGDRSWLMNFMKKFIGIVRFGNDHFGAIMGYGDYVIGDSVIYRVYYVDEHGHNLFSVRQFCDSDLEVAFRKHSCYVRDTDGVELIKGSHDSNLYTISVEDMMKSCPICLLSKASKNKSWV